MEIYGYTGRCMHDSTAHGWAELTERQHEILESPSAGGASLSLRRYWEAKAAVKLWGCLVFALQDQRTWRRGMSGGSSTPLTAAEMGAAPHTNGTTWLS